jgi:hypothetical protein
VDGPKAEETFDCSDAASVAQFSSEVAQWSCSIQEMPGTIIWVVSVPVPEPKTVKNRVHLDLVPKRKPC